MSKDDSSIRSAIRLELIAGGLAAIGAAGLWISGAPSDSLALPALALAVVAIVLAGVGISRTPKEGRVLGLAAVASLLSSFAIHPAWDSVVLLPRVMAGLAGVAAVVVLLPRPCQYGIVSLAVVFHFCGIMSAITSPPPTPWLSSILWTTVFRPHLMFCYTNNAYQFYSPQPGPACLLWFCIEYKDSDNDTKVTWLKMPKKPETRLDPLGVEYFRRLSLTEATNQTLPMLDIPPLILQRRLVRTDVPLHPDLPRAMQYRQPYETTRQMIASYARHVANEFGADRVRNIKIYRVEHRMLTEQQFAENRNPFDETTYVPYYLGEFDAQGQMRDPNDPLLYWTIPILRTATAPGTVLRPGQPVGGELLNCIKDHAGSDPFKE